MTSEDAFTSWLYRFPTNVSGNRIVHGLANYSSSNEAPLHTQTLLEFKFTYELSGWMSSQKRY